MGAVPNQRTWTDDEVVTASMFNSNIRDALNFFLVTRPFAQLYKTSTQSLTSGVFADVTFTSEEYDTDGGHSSSSNTARYTAQTAGKYLVSATLSYANNGTGQRLVCLTVNGARILASQIMYPSTLGNSFCISVPAMLVQLGVGDYVGVQGWQSSGGNLNLTALAAAEGCRMTVLYWAA